MCLNKIILWLEKENISTLNFCIFCCSIAIWEDKNEQKLSWTDHMSILNIICMERGRFMWVYVCVFVTDYILFVSCKWIFIQFTDILTNTKLIIWDKQLHAYSYCTFIPHDQNRCSLGYIRRYIRVASHVPLFLWIAGRNSSANGVLGGRVLGQFSGMVWWVEDVLYSN